MANHVEPDGDEETLDDFLNDLQEARDIDDSTMISILCELLAKLVPNAKQRVREELASLCGEEDEEETEDSYDRWEGRESEDGV